MSPHLFMALSLSMLDASAHEVILPRPKSQVTKAEYQVAARFSKALRRKAEFRESDFLAKFGPSDRAALSKFAECGADKPERGSGAFDVYIRLKCKGMPYTNPAAISLHFKDGKIARIELHNVDLMPSHG